MFLCTKAIKFGQHALAANLACRRYTLITKRMYMYSVVILRVHLKKILFSEFWNSEFSQHPEDISAVLWDLITYSLDSHSANAAQTKPAWMRPTQCTTNLTKTVHRHKTALQSSFLKYSIMNSDTCRWKPVYPQHIFPTLPYQPNSSLRKQSNLPVLPSQAAKGVPISVNWDNSSICIFKLLLASCQSASNLYHFDIMSI